jgi:hypothetical protein
MEPKKLNYTSRTSTSNVRKRSTKLEDLKRLLKVSETTLPYKSKHSFSYSVFTNQLSQEKNRVDKLIEKVKNNKIYDDDPLVKIKKLNGRQSLFKNYIEEKEKSDKYQMPKHVFNINAVDRISELGGLKVLSMKDIGLNKVQQESYSYKIIPRDVEFKEKIKSGIYNKFLDHKEARMRKEIDSTINKYYDSIIKINNKIKDKNNNHLRNLKKMISSSELTSVTERTFL